MNIDQLTGENGRLEHDLKLADAKIERLKADLLEARKVHNRYLGQVQEAEAEAATLRKALVLAIQGKIAAEAEAATLRKALEAVCRENAMVRSEGRPYFMHAALTGMVERALATDAGKEAADVLAAALEIDGRSGDKLFAAVQAYRAKGQADE